MMMLKAAAYSQFTASRPFDSFGARAKSPAPAVHDGLCRSPQAYRDIEEIWEYVAADNLSAADSIGEEIYEVIQRLVPFPGQGHALPDLTSRPLRFQILRDYAIEYAPAEEPLLVIAAMLRARE
jgi:plasmid stabilization system protein ParE